MWLCEASTILTDKRGELDLRSMADAKRTPSYSLDLHFLSNIRNFRRFVAMGAYKKSSTDLGPRFVQKYKRNYRTEDCPEIY